MTKTPILISAALAAMLGMTLTPAFAHHSISADFDEKKTTTVKGTIVKFDWVNPHVWTWVDSAEANGSVTSWGIEWASTPEMKRAGWTRNSVKVGDSVTIEGSTSRESLKQAYGKTLTLANGKKLAGVPVDAAVILPTVKSGKPAPRLPDGHVRLGSGPDGIGYWANPTSYSLVETSAGNIRMNSEGLLANIADAGKVAPFQPWAKGLYVYRQQRLLKDDPMASCLPPGGPRMFQAPYGFQILEDTDRQRIFFMSGGADRNWKLVYTDGRAMPKTDDLVATYFGSSATHWDKDTLVIESAGYGERFWFSNGGLPHTESLRLTEKLSRPDFDTLKYEVTVNDPGAYTRPWNAGWTLQWVAEDAVQEYYCDEYNRNLLPQHAAQR